jgi:hypothetical protein
MTASKRPPYLGALIGVLFLSGLVSIAFDFTGANAEKGMFYPAVNALLTVTMFVALSLAWELDRWGVYLFVVFAALKLALDLWVGAFVWWDGLLLPPLAYFFFFRSRFS